MSSAFPPPRRPKLDAPPSTKRTCLSTPRLLHHDFIWSIVAQWCTPPMLFALLRADKILWIILTKDRLCWKSIIVQIVFYHEESLMGLRPWLFVSYRHKTEYVKEFYPDHPPFAFPLDSRPVCGNPEDRQCVQAYVDRASGLEVLHTKQFAWSHRVSSPHDVRFLEYEKRIHQITYVQDWMRYLPASCHLRVLVMTCPLACIEFLDTAPRLPRLESIHVIVRNTMAFNTCHWHSRAEWNVIALTSWTQRQYKEKYPRLERVEFRSPKGSPDYSDRIMDWYWFLLYCLRDQIRILLWREISSLWHFVSKNMVDNLDSPSSHRIQRFSCLQQVSIELSSDYDGASEGYPHPLSNFLRDMAGFHTLQHLEFSNIDHMNEDLLQKLYSFQAPRGKTIALSLWLAQQHTVCYWHWQNEEDSPYVSSESWAYDAVAMQPKSFRRHSSWTSTALAVTKGFIDGDSQCFNHRLLFPSDEFWANLVYVHLMVNWQEDLDDLAKGVPAPLHPFHLTLCDDIRLRPTTYPRFLEAEWCRHLVGLHIQFNDHAFGMTMCGNDSPNPHDECAYPTADAHQLTFVTQHQYHIDETDERPELALMQAFWEVWKRKPPLRMVMVKMGSRMNRKFQESIEPLLFPEIKFQFL